MSVKEFQCRVISRRNLAPGVFELTFDAGEPFVFHAGQFISIEIPAQPPLRRAYSIASAPGRVPVELCVQLLAGGPGSTYLAGLRCGDSFRGIAPYGFFTYHPHPGRDVLFVATGTGIAPFRSMALSDPYRIEPPRRARTLLGVRAEADILYERDFRAMPGMAFVACLSQENSGGAGRFRGRVTDYLRGLGDAFPWSETEFYLCGNGAMIKEARAILKERGVARDAVHLEIYFQPKKPPA